MRSFKCIVCEHAWKLSFGEGRTRASLTSSDCGSSNVHLVLHDNGRDNKLDAVGSFLNHGRGRGRRWSR
jgi:hypothetical protein